ncbi:mannose-6-phosphate receptor binding domain-containing protein [Scheffersomyces coipomensis]|uniref:mannose-6-phosphate receptor binding domain-containing protein n=1 Tax=Scheffersomyces coipomensis TaxID=1788519 RepID=UPI00315CA462
MKVQRRVILPLAVLMVIVLVLLIEPKGQKATLYQAGSELWDSFNLVTSSGLSSTQKPEELQAINEYEKAKAMARPDGEVGGEEKSKEELELDPCTMINPANKGFIDLRSLSAFSNEGKAVPWSTRGFDSGKNYTLGICSNPFKKHRDDINEIQDGLNSTLIGAYYVDSETQKFVSLGEYSTTPKFRGKKLTLTYENGAYCNKLMDTETGERLRKSTILTFVCDREMMAKAAISYVGSSNDCSYYFEVRSHHACPTAAKANNLAAFWIFLFIVFAAALVYFSGGMLYKQMKESKSVKV